MGIRIAAILNEINMDQTNLTESSLILTFIKRGIDMIRNCLLIISFVLISNSTTLFAASRNFPELFDNPFKQLVNNPPIAVDDSILIKPFQEMAVDVLSNDYDPDRHSLRIISLSEQDPRKKLRSKKHEKSKITSFFSKNKKAEVVKQRISFKGCKAHISASNLKILLTCSGGHPRSRKLFYTVVDERGASSSAKLLIKSPKVEKRYIKPEVKPVQLVATDDIATTNINQSIILDVLKNDKVDYRNRKIIKISNISGGIADLVSNNRKIKVTPAVDSRKPVTFSYTIGTKNNKSTAYVKVLINSAPVANDDIATTNMNESITVNVLANDSDAGSKPLTVVNVFDVNGGEAKIVGSSRAIKVIPTKNAFSPVTLKYSISNNLGEIATAKLVVYIGKPKQVNVLGSRAYGGSGEDSAKSIIETPK